MPPQNNKKKQRKVNDNGNQRRELLFKEKEQEYAKVLKALGSSNFKLMCCDNIERIGKVRGKLGKRVWITENSLVLVGLRDFQDKKCDILHRYDDHEVRQLIKGGHITEMANSKDKDNTCNITFDGDNNNSGNKVVNDVSEDNDDVDDDFDIDEI